MKTTVREKILELLGLGLKAKATDATPAELADYALSARAFDEESDEEKKKKEAEDARRADDARRMAEDKKRADDMKAAEDKKRADDEAAAAEMKRKAEEQDSACKPGEEGHKDCTKDKCMAHDRGARDADGGHHRKRMHDALDSMLDKHEKEHGPLEGEDADVAELKNLMGKFLSEEEQEPEHAEHDDATPEMLEEVGEVEEPGSETMMANDAAEALLPVIEKSPERKVLQKAFDASPLEDGEFEFLKAMRPAIARSKDAKLRAAFDAQVRKYTRSSRVDKTGGYGAFGAAARHANDSAITDAARRSGAGPRAVDNTKINEIYSNYRNGKTPTR